MIVRETEKRRGNAKAIMEGKGHVFPFTREGAHKKQTIKMETIEISLIERQKVCFLSAGKLSPLQETGTVVRQWVHFVTSA